MDQICSKCNSRDGKFWELGGSNIRKLTDRTEVFRGFRLYCPTNYGVGRGVIPGNPRLFPSTNIQVFFFFTNCIRTLSTMLSELLAASLNKPSPRS